MTNEVRCNQKPPVKIKCLSWNMGYGSLNKPNEPKIGALHKHSLINRLTSLFKFVSFKPTGNGSRGEGAIGSKTHEGAVGGQEEKHSASGSISPPSTPPRSQQAQFGVYHGDSSFTRSPSPDENSQRLEEVIPEFHCDLIFIQEAPVLYPETNYPTFDGFRRRNLARYDYLTDNDKKSSMLLYWDKALQLIRGMDETTWELLLANNNLDHYRRLFQDTVVGALFERNGVYVLALGLHLPHKKSDAIKKERVQALFRLCALVKSLDSSDCVRVFGVVGPVMVVFAGDFNFDISRVQMTHDRVSIVRAEPTQHRHHKDVIDFCGACPDYRIRVTDVIFLNPAELVHVPQGNRELFDHDPLAFFVQIE